MLQYGTVLTAHIAELRHPFWYYVYSGFCSLVIRDWTSKQG